MMEKLNTSSETLLYNSSLVEEELDALEEQLRLLQAQADEDAQLIHSVIRCHWDNLHCDFVVYVYVTQSYTCSFNFKTLVLKVSAQIFFNGLATRREI